MRRIAIAISAAIALVLLAAAPASAQSANTIYVTPGTGSYPNGSTFTVSVRENSSSPVNAVQADLTYSQNLQFVSIDASGSAFGIDASSTGGGGSVTMARGTITPVSGDQLVAKVTFKVVGGGTLSVNVQDSSVALSSSTNTDVIKTRKGGTFASGSTGTAPAPTPAAPSPVSPQPGAVGDGSSNTPSSDQAVRGSLPVNTIAPLGSAQASAMPGDTIVELEAPATIVTTPDPTRKVLKVEYLLNDKVIAVDDTAPYSHTLETQSYRNGSYTFTTKTYYDDGQVDVSTSTIAIKNPVTLYQIWLQVLHYAWIIVIVLVIVAELIYLKFFRKRHNGIARRPLPGSGTIPGGMVSPVPGADRSQGGPTGQPTQSVASSAPARPMQMGAQPPTGSTVQPSGQPPANSPQPWTSSPRLESSEPQEPQKKQ